MSGTTVRLSHPSDLSSWGRSRLETPWFEAYLRRTNDRLTVGQTLEEFVGVGCCGSALDVPLRVEGIEGEGTVDDETEFVFEERAECAVEGGWRVQSAVAPDR